MKKFLVVECVVKKWNVRKVESEEENVMYGIRWNMLKKIECVEECGMRGKKLNEMTKVKCVWN